MREATAAAAQMDEICIGKNKTRRLSFLPVQYLFSLPYFSKGTQINLHICLSKQRILYVR